MKIYFQEVTIKKKYMKIRIKIQPMPCFNDPTDAKIILMRTWLFSDLAKNKISKSL